MDRSRGRAPAPLSAALLGAPWRRRAEARTRAFAGALGLDLPIARLGVRDQRSDQATRRVGDLRHRLRERRLVGLRGHAEAAQLADELEGGVADLELGGGRLEVEEGLDVSAHGDTAVRGWRRG